MRERKATRARAPFLSGLAGVALFGAMAGAGALAPHPPTATASLVNDAAADATVHDTQMQPTAVRAAGNVVLAAFEDTAGLVVSGLHGIGWSRSVDGGNTFVDQGALPFSTAGDKGFPRLAYATKTGTAFLATTSTTGAGIQLFRSTNNGTSWNAPVNVHAGYPGGTLDAEAIAVDNTPGSAAYGNVYVFARDRGPCNCIVFSRSTSDGTSFTHSILRSISVAVMSLEGLQVVVAPDHSVYVLWLENNDIATNVIKIRRSTDAAITFAPQTTVIDLDTSGAGGALPIGPMRTNGFPSAAVNPVTGQLYVAYNDLGATAADKGDVYLVTSPDFGAHWTVRARVNHDTTTNDQFRPSIAVNAAGTALQVGWFDRRNDDANQWMQRFNNVASISGGALTFRRDWSTGPSFPPVVGQDSFVAPTAMGDYETTVDNGVGFLGVHTDTRDSNAFHTNQPDVRRYTVAFAPVASDLGVSGIAAPPTATVGSTVTYTFTVARDALAGQINNVSAQFKPGNGNVVVQSAATTQGKCYLTSVAGVQCQLGAMVPSATITVTVTALVAHCGNLPIRGSVVHAGADPNSANNAQQVAATGIC